MSRRRKRRKVDKNGEDAAVSAAAAQGPDAPTAVTAAGARPELRGTVLNLTLRWLTPKDVGRCMRVCRGWHRQLAQISDDVWEETATNESSSTAVRAIRQATGRTRN